MFSQQDTRDLEVRLEIRRPFLRIDETDGGNDVMNALGALAAEQDSDRVSVVLPDNSLLRGSQLSLRRAIDVEVADGATFPAPMAFFRPLDEYLRSLIAADMV